MDKQNEVKAIANEICNYVKSKDMTSVSVVAKSPCLEYLHNTGIAEWLIKRGYGDTKAAVKAFAKELKPILDQLGLKIAVALDCCEDEDISLMVKKVEEAHELRLKLSELVKERQ